MSKSTITTVLTTSALALALIASWRVQPNAQQSPGCGVGGTCVQQSASRLDGGTNFRCDSTTTSPLTLLNPGGIAGGGADYLLSYIGNIEATGAVAAASPIAITSSNFNGTSPTFGSISGLALTQGGVAGPGPVYLTTPIKALPNTAPTLAIAAPANSTVRISACYIQAP